MTDEEKLVAGKHQMRYYSACQYPMWRITIMKTIKQILENADCFYAKLKVDLKQDDDETGDKTVHTEIKNGLFFEALSQSMQAIEELFSMMKYARDVSTFVKSVVVYRAGDVTKYIGEFNTDDFEYMMEQMQLLYFPLDEPWENTEVFEEYKKSVLLIKDYLKKLIAHHKKYNLHYNQYKHGQAVALRPFAKPPEDVPENMLEAGLVAFDSFPFDKRNKFNSTFPAMMIPDFHPAIAGHLRELHDDGNLLQARLHVLHIDELVEIAEMAYTLLNALWANLRTRCDIKDTDPHLELYFPIKDYRMFAVIGFPRSK